MSGWPHGEAEIEQLIANKQLQQIIGGPANGDRLTRIWAAELGTGRRPHARPTTALPTAKPAALTQYRNSSPIATHTCIRHIAERKTVASRSSVRVSESLSNRISAVTTF